MNSYLSHGTLCFLLTCNIWFTLGLLCGRSCGARCYIKVSIAVAAAIIIITASIIEPGAININVCKCPWLLQRGTNNANPWFACHKCKKSNGKGFLCAHCGMIAQPKLLDQYISGDLVNFENILYFLCGLFTDLYSPFLADTPKWTRFSFHHLPTRKASAWHRSNYKSLIVTAICRICWF